MGTVTFNKVTLAHNMDKNGVVYDVNINNYYTQTEIDQKLGDIGAALDSILTIQETIIGGNN